MSETSAGGSQGSEEGLALAFVRLRKTGFERRVPADDPPPGRDAAGVELRSGAARLDQSRLIVTLEVKADDPNWSFEAVFEAGFELGADILRHDDSDTIIRRIAGQIGPAAMYPYVRETLSSLSNKAGLPTVLLPVVNFGRDFAPETVEIQDLFSAELRD